MKRHLKSLVVITALGMALVLTITRHGTNRLGGLGVVAGEPTRAAPAGTAPGDKKYDLTQLHVFNATLMRINDSYVDPTRVDPKAMLLAALDYAQKNVAEVLVEPHPEKNKVTVRVDTQQREFSIDDVDSPWALSQKMREIFRFVGANLQPGTEVKDLEYAATNGMLSTLDPHSVLLDPPSYADMKLSTRGQFGGLGIVIGIRKGNLTVIKPMPGTPASQAGIKAGDKIVRIEKESTTNMMLSDAVSRLRGDPDSKVEVWTQRGDTPARRLLLTRAVISVDTVESHYLKNNIGYIRLKQFSGNTYEEMHRSLEDMKQKGGLKGLVLDLRGDPGGLYDQAIKVSDEFVDSGTLVTTVGYANKQRDEKRAKQEGTQPHFPMAVLVNQGSASASEIVAGALKNLDRAVIIGSRTFGKGSVQVLYDNEDGSALKLTIAQYLTPGDVSIQSVGIVPDVVVEPTALTKDRISIFRTGHGLREQDLDAHLTSHNTRAGDKPTETLRYLSEQAAKKKDAAKANGEEEETPAEEPDDEVADANDDSKFVEDYEITMARDLLSQAHGWRRREVLASKGFFEKKSAEEQLKIAETMRKLGVDWSTERSGGAAHLQASFTTDKVGHQVTAGEMVTLKATVTNQGQGDAVRVRAITRCDDPLLDDREFVFGKLHPGETRSWTVPVKVERAWLTRLDSVKLDVYDDGSKVETEKLPLKIEGMSRPRFAYSYQLVDDKGNVDGQVGMGQSYKLHVTVKNSGEGKSFETLATLSNKSGDGVNVLKGRYNVDNLQPGESRTIDFTFDVTPEFHGDAVSVQMDVYDQVLREYVTDKLTFPVKGSSAPLAKSPSGPLASTAPTAPSAAAKQVVPPRLTIDHPPLAVDATSFRLTGTASDEQQVTDVFIFVSNRSAKMEHRKVYYLSNRKSANPKQARFEATIPVWAGANNITVVARQSGHVQTQETIIVQGKGEPPAQATALY